MGLALAGSAMSTLLTDLRLAVRLLWKDRRFTVVALVALALGIGATSAIYTVIDSVLLRPLPFSDPGALVEIQSAARNGPGASAFADFQDVRARNHTLDSAAAYLDTTVTLTGSADPRQLASLSLTPSLFQVLGAQPILGRALTDADAVVGSQAIVISHALWQGRYRGDPEIIGRAISLDGRQAVIVGVMAAGFRFPLDRGDDPPLVFLPFPREQGDLPLAQSRGMHAFAIVGRAKAATSLAAVRSDLDAVASAMRVDHPAEGEDKNLTLHVTAMRESIVGPVRPALILLLCAVVCVLVIACANVAGLLLARATVRQREVAIRSTLGATRGRIIRQLLTESALLGVIGGTAGLLLALWLVDLLTALVAPSLPTLHGIAIDGRVLAVTAAVSLVSSLAFGLVPALHASRVDLQESLKESTRSSSHGSRRARNALLVAEMAVALVLLFGAGLALRSFSKLRTVDPGFRPKGSSSRRSSCRRRAIPRTATGCATTTSWRARSRRCRARRPSPSAGRCPTRTRASAPAFTCRAAAVGAAVGGARADGEPVVPGGDGHSARARAQLRGRRRRREVGAGAHRLRGVRAQAVPRRRRHRQARRDRG